MTDLEGFRKRVLVIVDEIRRRIAPWLRRSGPHSRGSQVESDSPLVPSLVSTEGPVSDVLVSKLRADDRLSRIADSLIAMFQPAIRLRTFPCREDALPLGSTRIGGRPDLTDDVIWPVWKDRPLAFLAQINLNDLARFPFASVLPQSGWLLFFYDAEQLTWGFDPQDLESWRVILMPDDGSPLTRRGIPAKALRNGFYKPCRIEMQEILTAPPVNSPFVRELNLTESEEDKMYIGSC